MYMDQVLPWQQVISGVATCCSGSACWMWRLQTHFHRSAEHRRRIKSPRCLPSLRSSSVSSSFNGGCWTGENNRMTFSCHAVAVGQGSLILCRYFFAWTRRRLWSWFGRARLLGCLQVVSRLRAHHVCQQRVHADVRGHSGRLWRRSARISSTRHREPPAGEQEGRFLAGFSPHLDPKLRLGWELEFFSSSAS